MYDFHCSLPIFMKLTTQWRYVGISMRTVTQIAHEISKYGKHFFYALMQRTTVSWFLRNSRLFENFLQELPPWLRLFTTVTEGFLYPDWGFPLPWLRIFSTLTEVFHYRDWGFLYPNWGFTLPWLRVFSTLTEVIPLPWLMFFRAFSSFVRQTPGYNSQNGARPAFFLIS
jgi:hypothetical protein